MFVCLLSCVSAYVCATFLTKYFAVLLIILGLCLLAVLPACQLAWLPPCVLQAQCLITCLISFSHAFLPACLHLLA